jgi:DoxX-like family
MSEKTKRIIAIVLMVIPALIMLMSAFLKLTGNQMMVQGLTKMGFGGYIRVLGLAELIFIALLFIPSTRKIGFLFILSYLGGAAATEIASGKPPMSLLLIALLWISLYLQNKYMFSAKKNDQPSPFTA